MKFNPNYKTKDGAFEIVIDIESLTNQKPEKSCYYQNKELTKHKIVVYNTDTNRMSDKSIYYNKKKGGSFYEDLCLRRIK